MDFRRMNIPRQEDVVPVYGFPHGIPGQPHQQLITRDFGREENSNRCKSYSKRPHGDEKLDPGEEITDIKTGSSDRLFLPTKEEPESSKKVELNVPNLKDNLPGHSQTLKLRRKTLTKAYKTKHGFRQEKFRKSNLKKLKGPADEIFEMEPNMDY